MWGGPRFLRTQCASGFWFGLKRRGAPVANPGERRCYFSRGGRLNGRLPTISRATELILRALRRTLRIFRKYSTKSIGYAKFTILANLLISWDLFQKCVKSS